MCIFCKIVNNEISSYTIFEDDKVKAFLDISQVTRGHTLIIPKQHFDNFMECDDDTLMHVTKVTKQLANHLIGKTGATGMNILSNINEVAGQSVPHFHIHLIPRYGEEDACQIVFNPSAEQDKKVLQSLLKVST